MESGELNKKIEVQRQKELLRITRPSWLIYMAQEDSRRTHVIDLNKRPFNGPINSKKDSTNDGP